MVASVPRLIGQGVPLAFGRSLALAVLACASHNPLAKWVVTLFLRRAWIQTGTDLLLPAMVVPKCRKVIGARTLITARNRPFTTSGSQVGLAARHTADTTHICRRLRTSTRRVAATGPLAVATRDKGTVNVRRHSTHKTTMAEEGRLHPICHRPV
jgi:hypothetical protein